MSESNLLPSGELYSFLYLQFTFKIYIKRISGNYKSDLAEKMIKINYLYHIL